MSFATKTYINKSIQRLYGIIEGISIDCKINEMEIIALKNWIETHRFLRGSEPFLSLDELLTDILSDGVVDPDEKKILLEWCADTLNEKGFIDGFTKITRRLHGIMVGIACDKKITSEEIENLQDWLLDYEQLNGWWPFNELNKLIKKILKDGIIDEAEYSQVQAFFDDFAEQVINEPAIHDEIYWTNPHISSPCPVFNPISSICDKNTDIKFKNKTFCFTGPAASGKRKDLFDIVHQLDGYTTKNIVNDLDYLVIGAQSSPAWVYSTYGRKIESVMERNKDKSKFKAKIINELDFINAIKSNRSRC